MMDRSLLEVYPRPAVPEPPRGTESACSPAWREALRGPGRPPEPDADARVESRGAKTTTREVDSIEPSPAPAPDDSGEGEDVSGGKHASAARPTNLADDEVAGGDVPLAIPCATDDCAADPQDQAVPDARSESPMARVPQPEHEASRTDTPVTIESGDDPAPSHTVDTPAAGTRVADHAPDGSERKPLPPRQLASGKGPDAAEPGTHADPTSRNATAVVGENQTSQFEPARPTRAAPDPRSATTPVFNRQAHTMTRPHARGASQAAGKVSATNGADQHVPSLTPHPLSRGERGRAGTIEIAAGLTGNDDTAAGGRVGWVKEALVKGVAPLDTGSGGGTSPSTPSGGEQSGNLAHRSPDLALPRGSESPQGAVTPQQQVRIVQRVAGAIQAAARETGIIRLRLHPAELGALHLEVSLRKGVLRARLETETETARHLLLEQLPQLRGRLEEQGIRVEQFEVDLGRRDTPDSQGRPDQQDLTPGTPHKGPADRTDRTATNPGEEKCEPMIRPVVGRIDVVI